MNTSLINFRKALVTTFCLAFGLLLGHPLSSTLGGETGSGGGGTGSGGGGTGGGGGGGGGATVQPYAIKSFGVTAGYRPGGGASGAVWTSYSVQVPSNVSPIVRLRITNLSTRQLVWDSSYYIASQTVDDDFVPFSTSFLVELQLLDYSGNLLGYASATVTTPPRAENPTLRGLEQVRGS